MILDEGSKGWLAKDSNRRLAVASGKVGKGHLSEWQELGPRDGAVSSDGGNAGVADSGFIAMGFLGSTQSLTALAPLAPATSA